jgi:hypothetical protein
MFTMAAQVIVLPFMAALGAVILACVVVFMS